MGDGVLNGMGGSGLLPGRKWRSSWEEEAFFVWLGERVRFFSFYNTIDRIVGSWRKLYGTSRRVSVSQTRMLPEPR